MVEKIVPKVVNYGAMCKPLKEQGLAWFSKVDYYQGLLDASVDLWISGMLTDKQYDSVSMKIAQKMFSAAHKEAKSD